MSVKEVGYLEVIHWLEKPRTWNQQELLKADRHAAIAAKVAIKTPANNINHVHSSIDKLISLCFLPQLREEDYLAD